LNHSCNQRIAGRIVRQASAELAADMSSASSPAVVGYYTEHCHPQLRGQTVFVQLADQSTDFKRDAMSQVIIDFPLCVAV